MDWTYHEVALDELELTREPLLDGVVGGTVDLVVVVVKTSDVGVGELGDLARRSSDATADIEHLHALLYADLRGKIVLMASDGLVKASP